MLIHLAPITQIDREITMTVKPAPFPFSSGVGREGEEEGGERGDDLNDFNHKSLETVYLGDSTTARAARALNFMKK